MKLVVYLSAVCSNKARLLSFLFTGARTVVHPKARIIAEAGPIVIGEGNLIEEQALIINRYVYYNTRVLFNHQSILSYLILPVFLPVVIQRISCQTQREWSPKP